MDDLTTDLLRAVQFYHNSTRVALLLDCGASINGRGRRGLTALMWAARGTYPEDAKSARILLERGAEVNIGDEVGYTALMRAANVGNVAMVKLLLTYGADVNQQDQYGRTALIEGVRSRSALDTVETLVKAGADVNAQSNAGQSVLTVASRHTSYGQELVELLRQVGARE